MLRRLGQAAALLDGGLAAWPGPLDTGAETRPAVARRPRPWPAAFVRDADRAGAAAASPDAVVLDARVRGRYTGAEGLPSERRRGHVPGARNAPWPDNLGDDGTFRSPDELRARYAALGVDGRADVVVYCGSGVTACHDLLALERAGFPPAALYPGSWSAWSEDDARPVATGDHPEG
jgi:thiosulfate/3-mercaptopyruvate sulfurtransferase